jgi:hypothetical protein
MLSIMLPHRSTRYFLSAPGTASRLLCFALGVALLAAAAPAVAQGGPVPTATVVTPAPAAPPPAAGPPAAVPAPVPGPAPGGVAPAPVAPPAVAPEAGAELPSLAPSPLLEPRSNAQPSSEPSETDARALTEFRPTLDAYGGWVEHPSYGLVWVPRRDVVGEGFAPYVTSGHWALDTGGDWVWVSDYPFGSIVFHYGRWAYVSDSGWVWVPGYRYAPAWVSWRVPTGSYAYVGWAPLPPDYGWFGGVSVSLWWGYPTPWVFCPSAYAFHRHVDHYVVRDRALVTRLAASSSRYVPARPRRRAADRTLAGPAPSEARIPAHAVPRERIQVAVPERRFEPSRGFERAVPPLRAPSRLPDRRLDSTQSRRSTLSPTTLERVRPPEQRPNRERAERRVEQQRVERQRVRVERDRVERRLDRDRLERRPDFGRERVRAPRPSASPFSPGNASKMRRPK